MIGVPIEDRYKIFHWTNQALGAADAGQIDPEYFQGEGRAEQAQVEMFTYVYALCEERRQAPRDDIASGLLNAEVDGEKLTDLDLGAFFMFLSSAGTKRPQRLRTIHASREPGAVGQVRARSRRDDRRCRRRDAAMVVARDVPAAQRHRRHGGCAPRPCAGDKGRSGAVSANRDEDVFEDPFRFDIERNPNDHRLRSAGSALLPRREPSLGSSVSSSLRWRQISRAGEHRSPGVPALQRGRRIKHLHRPRARRQVNSGQCACRRSANRRNRSMIAPARPGRRCGRAFEELELGVGDGGAQVQLILEWRERRLRRREHQRRVRMAAT
jgi:hypothetical protein